MAQEGVARGVDIDLPHVTQYVRPLIQTNLVRERTAHVRGVRRRRKVYDLTEPGRMAALGLREKMKAEHVRLRDSEGEREATLAQVLKEVGGRATALGILRLFEQEGIVDLTALFAPVRRSLVERLSDAPRIGSFVGRTRELEMVTGEVDGPRLFVVRGVAGIGKSAFAARACELLRGTKNLFWHRVRSWDTPQSVMADLGEFFSLLGKPGLVAVLTRGEAAKALQVLRRDLPGTSSFLVFDDAHESNPEVLSLLRFLKEAVAEMRDVRALVLTRRRIHFYDRRDVALHGIVREIDLGGLAPEDVATFLSGTLENVATAGVHLGLGGHPLFLQLVRASPRASMAAEARRNVHRFIEETIYGELSEAERRMMKVACLYKVPLPRGAFFPDSLLSYDILASLTDKSLIIPVGQENFEVHDTIQEFFTTILTEPERRHLAAYAIRELRDLATKAIANEEFISSIGYLSNAVQLASSSEERVALLEALGDAHERIGDLQGSLRAYGDATKEAQDPEVRARLHRKVAWAFQVRGQISAASTEVESALRALGDAPSVERGWLDLVRCQISFHLEEWQEARQRGGAALKEFRELDLLPGQARVLQALGNTEIDSPDGDPRLAEQRFAASLDLARLIGDPEIAARAHIALARLFAYRIGNAEKAMQHIREIEPLLKTERDPHMRRSFLMLKGWYNLEIRGDYPSAEAHFKEAMALGQRIYDVRTVTSAGYALAFVSYFRGLFDEARSGFQQSTEEFRTQGSPDVIEPMWMVAECSLLQGDINGFRETTAAFDDPELAKSVESRTVMVKVSWGLNCLIQGDEEGFHAAFTEALALAHDQFNFLERPLLHFVHFFYGVALRALGRDLEGEEHLHRARELLRPYSLEARLSVMPEHERRITGTLGRAAGRPGVGGVGRAGGAAPSL